MLTKELTWNDEMSCLSKKKKKEEEKEKLKRNPI